MNSSAKRFVFFYRFIYLFHSHICVCFHLVWILNEIWTHSCLNDFQFCLGRYRAHSYLYCGVCFLKFCSMNNRSSERNLSTLILYHKLILLGSGVLFLTCRSSRINNLCNFVALILCFLLVKNFPKFSFRAYMFCFCFFIVFFYVGLLWTRNA